MGPRGVRVADATRRTSSPGADAPLARATRAGARGVIRGGGGGGSIGRREARVGRSMSPGTLRGGATTTTTTWRVSERVGRDTRSRARSGDGRRLRRHLRDVVRGASVRGALASERRVAPVAHRRGVAPALRRLVVRSRAAHARARKILETSRALDVHGGRTRRAVSALDGGAGGDGGDGARGGRAGGPEPKTRMVRGARRVDSFASAAAPGGRTHLVLPSKGWNGGLGRRTSRRGGRRRRDAIRVAGDAARDRARLRGSGRAPRRLSRRGRPRMVGAFDVRVRRVGAGRGTPRARRARGASPDGEGRRRRGGCLSRGGNRGRDRNPGGPGGRSGAARGRGRGRRERRGCRKRFRGVGRGRRGVPRDAPARPARRSRERAAPGDDGDGGGGGGGERGSRRCEIRRGTRSVGPRRRRRRLHRGGDRRRRRVSSRGVRGDVSRRRPRKYPRGRGVQSGGAGRRRATRGDAPRGGRRGAPRRTRERDAARRGVVSHHRRRRRRLGRGGGVDGAPPGGRVGGAGSGAAAGGGVSGAAATTCSTRISTRFPAWAGPRAARAPRRRPSR